MELLDAYLATIYFQLDDKFYQQEDGMAVGNSPFPVVSNKFMERFEDITLDTAEHKPDKWLG
jgi:hypothetical protein